MKRVVKNFGLVFGSLSFLLSPVYANEADSSKVTTTASAPADPIIEPSSASNIPKNLPAIIPGEIASKRLRKALPLERLIFSARQGFSLRMTGNEQVTAEIRNGSGRILARSEYQITAGDWVLHPKNLAPGVYTVLLRTGDQLRSMRMKIEDTERGHGSPEWVLEKGKDDSTLKTL